MKESLAGNLLIASSLLEQPVVNRAVCLLVHHDEDGAIGVMLNRPMQPNPQAMLELIGGGSSADPPEPIETPRFATADEGEASRSSGSAGALLHFGGPLSGPLVAIHGSSQYAEAETGQGIYVAAQRQHLEQLVRQHPCPYRLIVGHLGWGPDQLRSELHQGYWHLLPATAQDVFTTDEAMWPQLIRRATANSLARWIGTPDVPGAAELN